MASLADDCNRRDNWNDGRELPPILAKPFAGFAHRRRIVAGFSRYSISSQDYDMILASLQGHELVSIIKYEGQLNSDGQINFAPGNLLCEFAT